MKIEQKNMFTGQYDVVYPVEPDEFEVEQDRLLLEPFLCPCCKADTIEPEWEGYYDEDEDKVYNYYHHYCFTCQYKDVVDITGFSVRHIEEEKFKMWKREQRELEKLYDRRLL